MKGIDIQNKGGCERDANGRKAGKGPLIQYELAGTIGVSQDQHLFMHRYGGGKSAVDILENRSPTLTTTHYGEPVVCYNSSGDGISGTLDANYYKGQGVVYGVEREYVVCIEGNGSRPSHQVDGFKESQTMYTLNTTEVHAVAYAYDARGNGGGCDSANADR